MGLLQDFSFYNEARPHQALGYRTPDTVYVSGAGGGAMILGKYASAAQPQPATA